MKVIISVGGRFHAFNLAEQLEKRGYLGCLITSYPKFEVVKYGIPRNKIRSVLLKEVIQRSWSRLPSALKRVYNPQYLIHEIYDLLASRNVREADLFVGWSSFSLYSLRRAKAMGMKTVIDRGSSHIAFQNRILKEEYERFGIVPWPFQLPHPKLLKKKLKSMKKPMRSLFHLLL